MWFTRGLPTLEEVALADEGDRNATRPTMTLGRSSPARRAVS
jgi:hypothetical protein